MEGEDGVNTIEIHYIHVGNSQKINKNIILKKKEPRSQHDGTGLHTKISSSRPVWALEGLV